jgi:chromosome segregation ATPase
MSCAHKALLVVIVVTSLGLWGCTQNRGGSTAARVRDLEARNAKLEEDYKASVADGTEVRKKLADTEEQVARLTRQASQVTGLQKERDRLRRQVTTTQTERNALQARLQEFSRDLQALVGRVDSAVGGTAPAPATTATSTAAPGSL